ncbi:hypothetical protein BZA70DRAFT_153402 [Myxozyma melibiosi]|uniref:F-box domain-containing protein n=1 Tax=Myxozyma melibiosi TaxID=54550 RepID=A0ABR1F8C8_9ASCO
MVDIDKKQRSLQALPREILLEIISYVPSRTLIALCNHSHFWRGLIHDNPTFWRDLEFSADETAADESAVLYVEKYAANLIHMQAVLEGCGGSCSSEDDEDSLEDVQIPLILISPERCLARYRLAKYDDDDDGDDKSLEREEPVVYNARRPLWPEQIKEKLLQVAKDILEERQDFVWREKFVWPLINLQLATWDPAVWGVGSSADPYDCRVAWEFLRCVESIHMPLGDMMTFFARCAAAEKKESLRIFSLRFFPQSGSPVNIRSKQLELGTFYSLSVLSLNVSDDEVSCSPPRPRAQISQNMLAQLVRSFPELRMLELHDFLVSSDSSDQGKLEMRNVRHVDFSGTEFECGFPLLKGECHFLTLVRSPHVADLFGSEGRAEGLLQHLWFIDLSDNPDITDTMIIDYLDHISSEHIPGGLFGSDGLLALRNCPRLEFSSQLLERLYIYFGVIDISQNKAVTDHVLSELLQVADVDRTRELGNPLDVNVSRTSVTEEAYKRSKNQHKSVKLYWWGDGESSDESEWKMLIRRGSSTLARSITYNLVKTMGKNPGCYGTCGGRGHDEHTCRKDAGISG